MHLAIAFILMVWLGAASQISTSQGGVVRDPEAVSLLQKSVTAMSNGVAISDVSLSGTATRIAGSDQQSGQVALEAKGSQESRITLSLSGYTFTEVRNFANGSAAGSFTGPGGIVHTTALHNCFTDSAWFFPLLSSLGFALNNSTLNVVYIGKETLNGNAVLHVAIWQSVSSPDASAAIAIAHLSTMDWYLDPVALTPVAAHFAVHPTDDASKDFAVEIRFSNYQVTNGVLVPLHVQKFLNGGLVLELTISSAVLNSGLPDTDFTQP